MRAELSAGTPPVPALDWMIDDGSVSVVGFVEAGERQRSECERRGPSAGHYGAGLIRVALCALALLALSRAAVAAECPDEDMRLLFHSCHGEARAELLLLPEETPALTERVPGHALIVGGAYTGTDQREEGRPNPVGLFVDNGRVVSPNLARMDGILSIGPDGEPGIHLARDVPTDRGSVDLTDPDQRLGFAARAAEQGVSVMQSHLLIANGKVDVSEQPDAPRARRRMLFSGPAGWGVYQTAEAVTLHDAAWELQRRFGDDMAPEMALNLDMGSYDYCIEIRAGAASNCGVLGITDTSKLSNALRLSRGER